MINNINFFNFSSVDTDWGSTDFGDTDWDNGF
jgi:hypothetical protein